MEINSYGSPISVYGANSGYESLKKDPVGFAPAAKKMDKADFSVPAKQRSTEDFKAELKKAIEAAASPERIETLKMMVAKGTYSVAAEAVAAAIFEGY